MHIFSIKKRYLFPLIYFVLFGVAIATQLGAIAMILWLPSSLPLLFIEAQMGLSQGTLTGGSSFLVSILVGAVPYIILGVIWDWVASYFRNKSFSGD